MAHKRELLQKVATEMNTVMALTPPIDHEMMDDDSMLDEIKRNATGDGQPKDAILAKDAFSAEVWAFFVSVGVWDTEKKVAIMPKKTKAVVVEPTEEEAAHDEMEAGESDEPAPKAEKAPKPVKAEKPVKAPKAEKPAKPAKVPKAEKPVKAPKPVKEPKAKKAAKAKVELDKFGCRTGTNNAKAMEMFATGKHTMAEVTKKLGRTFYDLLKKVEAAGHKVKTDAEKKITVK